MQFYMQFYANREKDAFSGTLSQISHPCPFHVDWGKYGTNFVAPNYFFRIARVARVQPCERPLNKYN